MIFVDTSFLIAVFSKGDENHSRAKETLQRYRGRRLSDLCVTTTYVVSETVTWIRTSPPRSHQAAVRAGELLFKGAFGRVHRPSHEQEQAAWDYFKRYQDKEYSFADCVSFTVMEDLGIREAFSVDRDFTHRFTAVPGPK